MTSLMGPADAPFRQQRLPAWQPILSPPYVISCFLLITAIFIPIGGVILSASSSVVEQIVRYDNEPISNTALCDAISVPNCTCADVFDHHRVAKSDQPLECTHTIRFRVSSEIPAPVYMYYRLTNYHQNHRRFAKSRYDPQLAGRSVTESELSTDCDPFSSQDGQIVNPCGLIAWALFNDSFVLYEDADTGNLEAVCNTSVPSRAQCTAVNNPFYSHYQPSCGAVDTNRCEKDGIAWASDSNTKFKQSADYVANKKYVSFPNFYKNETGHRIPDVNDEDLMVWMRTAAMPTFRKLMRKIRVPLRTGIDYQLDITERYPVRSFSGTKALVFANNAWIGGRSELLGSAYLAIGAICAILAACFLLKHVLSPRDPGDLAFFQNQRD